MALLEMAAAVLMIVILGIGLPAGWIWATSLLQRRTIEGKIEHKQRQVAIYENYLDRLAAKEPGEVRQAYLNVALQKRAKVQEDLDVLLAEKERQDFEKIMKKE